MGAIFTDSQINTLLKSSLPEWLGTGKRGDKEFPSAGGDRGGLE